MTMTRLLVLCWSAWPVHGEPPEYLDYSHQNTPEGSVGQLTILLHMAKKISQLCGKCPLSQIPITGNAKKIS